MAKAKTKFVRRYPEPVQIRSGCKVSWEYFSTREDAEAASIVAKADGVKYAALGYDYGYCCPGEITEMKGDTPHGRPELKGLWEVCFP